MPVAGMYPTPEDYATAVSLLLTIILYSAPATVTVTVSL